MDYFETVCTKAYYRVVLEDLVRKYFKLRIKWKKNWPKIEVTLALTDPTVSSAEFCTRPLMTLASNVLAPVPLEQ